MEESTLFFEKTMDNGVQVEIRDLTHRYYGDYHKVQLELTLRVGLEDALFLEHNLEQPALEKARRLWGNEARSVRCIERMAVPSDLVDKVRTDLWESFRRSSLDYLQRPDFPARFVMGLLNQIKLSRAPLRPIG